MVGKSEVKINLDKISHWNSFLFCHIFALWPPESHTDLANLKILRLLSSHWKQSGYKHLNTLVKKPLILVFASTPLERNSASLRMWSLRCEVLRYCGKEATEVPKAAAFQQVEPSRQHKVLAVAVFVYSLQQFWFLFGFCEHSVKAILGLGYHCGFCFYCCVMEKPSTLPWNCLEFRIVEENGFLIIKTMNKMNRIFFFSTGVYCNFNFSLQSSVSWSSFPKLASEKSMLISVFIVHTFWQEIDLEFVFFPKRKNPTVQNRFRSLLGTFIKLMVNCCAPSWAC